jgi:hypothetical protein
MTKTGAALVAASMAGLALAALGAGAWRWRRATETLVARVTAPPAMPGATRFDEAELEGLPEVVARYFHVVLRPGQPIVAVARLRQEGVFRGGGADDTWRAFTATQTFRARPPGFVWDARIGMGPGVTAFVRDAYAGRAGSMHAAAFGLVPVVSVSGTPEMAAGALQRYLAEAAWFPTALLPGQGVRWTAIDRATARATLADGPTTVALDFRFAGTGEIEEVFTGGRFREAGGRYELTPWGGRFRDYELREGMRVPASAEVWWRVGGREVPYWRGRVTSAAFEFTTEAKEGSPGPGSGTHAPPNPPGGSPR